MKKSLTSIILLFVTFSVFATQYKETITPKNGNGYTIVLDCYEEGDNVFIRPIAYQTGKKETTFNKTSYGGGGKHTDFIAVVKDKGTYCVGFMTDDINHGIGYCEMIDCKDKTQALEILYVFSVLLIEGDKNGIRPHYYPRNFVTEGIEDTTYSNTQYEDLFPTWKTHTPEMLHFIETELKPKYYFFPEETGFTKSVPLAHITDGDFYGILKRSNGYYIYRAVPKNSPGAGVLGGIENGAVGADSALGIYLDAGKTFRVADGQPSLDRDEFIVKLERLKIKRLTK